MKKSVATFLTSIALGAVSGAVAAQAPAPGASAESPKPASLGLVVYPGSGQDAAQHLAGRARRDRGLQDDQHTGVEVLGQTLACRPDEAQVRRLGRSERGRDADQRHVAGFQRRQVRAGRQPPGLDQRGHRGVRHVGHRAAARGDRLSPGGVDLQPDHGEAGFGDRVQFQVATAAAFPGRYDLILLLDCLHDMGDPEAACRHIRAALEPDGTLLLVEPLAGDRLQDNLTPLGRAYFAASTLRRSCPPR